MKQIRLIAIAFIALGFWISAQELNPQSNYRLTLHNGTVIEGKLLSQKGAWIKILHEETVSQFNLYFVAKIEKIPEPEPPSNNGGKFREDRADELSFVTWNAEWLFLHASRKDQINADRPGSFDESDVAMENRPKDLEEEEWKFSSVATVLSSPASSEICIPQVIALQEVGALTDAKEVARRVHEKTGYTYTVFSRSKPNYAPGHDSALLIRDTLRPVEIDYRQEILNLSQKEEELKSFTHLNGIPMESAFPRICMVTIIFQGQKILVASIHLTSGETKDNLRQANVLQIWIRMVQELYPEQRMILIGDFNDFEDRATLSIIQNQQRKTLQDALYTAQSVNGSLHLDPNRIGPLTTNQYSPKPIDHLLISHDFFENNSETQPIILERVWIVRQGVIIGEVDPRNRRGTRHEMLHGNERDISDHYPIFFRFRKKS
ncbi:MAG: hypothetical protein AABZ60_02640 [Planctomycetota bacterium]